MSPEPPELSGTREQSRVVIDTNVLVSAVIFPGSIPGRALGPARQVSILLTTSELVKELHDVLARPKFDRYLSADLRDAFVAAYISEAEFVRVTERIFVRVTERIIICRDPKDDCVLEAAVCGHASVVISGDDDPLVLSPFRGVPVVTPTSYLAQLGAQDV